MIITSFCSIFWHEQAFNTLQARLDFLRSLLIRQQVYPYRQAYLSNSNFSILSDVFLRPAVFKSEIYAINVIVFNRITGSSCNIRNNSSFFFNRRLSRVDFPVLAPGYGNRYALNCIATEKESLSFLIICSISITSSLISSVCKPTSSLKSSRVREAKQMQKTFAKIFIHKPPRIWLMAFVNRLKWTI